VNQADDQGDAPLSVAPNAKIATMLIERGANVNAVNKRGVSALWLAAKGGREDVVVVLLRAGANVKRADKNRHAPLSVAAKAKIATMLIERGANVKALNQWGQSALWLAAMGGRADVVEVLLHARTDVNQADKNGVTPIGVAANEAVAMMLIERGADVNAVNKRGESALWQAIQGSRHDVVEALVQAGADVNRRTRNGTTPLGYAANGRHWSMLTTLARSNRLANVDAVNCDGRTALWLALSDLRQDARDAATALICAGADIDLYCDGKTLLQAVAYSGNTGYLSLLLAAGAAPASVSAVDCKSYDVMSLMVAAGVAWTGHEIEQALKVRGWNADSERALAKMRSRVPAAKKRIERAGFAAIRARVLEICVALQEIEMPAPQLIEIVTHACAPFAAQLPYHYLWDAVVLVKHFRSRKAK
jgi:ankyrin repeat protein